MADYNAIKSLPSHVIAKIAAGEVVERPSRVIKELLENSLDASATEIKVEIDGGGLQSLKIIDNGKGIMKADFPLLCRRYATSKISSYEEIKEISTFGFRGEALASISCLSRISVISKTKNDKCAYKASYSNGELARNPEPCAGRQGTQIVVQDLFHNIPIRQRVFHSSMSEEKNRCLDIVKKYAIDNPTANFIYKQQKSKKNDLCSPLSKRVTPNSLSMIRLSYGSAISEALEYFSGKQKESKLEFEGYMSGPYSKLKKTTHIIFVNKRLISWKDFSAEIQSLFKGLVHKKFKTFLYLSLRIDPKRVDVNVHPKKEEILILNEKEVIELIIKSIKSRLFSNKNENVSVKSILSLNKKCLNSDDIVKDNSKSEEIISGSRFDYLEIKPDNNSQERKKQSLTPESKKSYPKDTVRISNAHEDEGKIEAFFEYPQKRILTSIKEKHYNAASIEPQVSKKTRKEEIETVKELLQEIESDIDEDMTQVFRNMSFVGRITPELILIQFRKKLMSIDTKCVKAQLIKYLALKNFGKTGHVFLEKPIKIDEAIEEMFHRTFAKAEKDLDIKVISQRAKTFLIGKRSMLNECFSIKFDESGSFLALPDIVKGVKPREKALGNFIFSMILEVDWKNKRKSIEDIAELLAVFYTNESAESAEIISQDKAKEEEVDLKTIFFPLFKSMKPSMSLSRQGAVCEVSSLDRFYSSFERC